MKNFSIFFILLVSIGCSKNDDFQDETGSSGLLKSIISPTSNSNYSSDITTKLFYINGSKLKRMEFYQKTIDYTNDFTFIFFYEGDLIIKIETFKNDNDQPHVIDYFEYNSAQRLIKYVRNFIGDITSYEYSYLANGNIGETIILNDIVNPLDKKELKIQHNNLVEDSHTKYTYDNMKSPYYGITGLDKIYFVNKRSPFDNYPSYKNNIIKTIRTDITSVLNYTYEYNSDGKPTKNNFTTFYNYY